MLNLCGSFVLEADDSSGHTWIIPIRCNSWDCPFCGPSKKKKLLQRLKPSEANLFITLTCDPAKFESIPDAFHALRTAFQHWIKRIRRAFPQTQVEYFAVWETTKLGWPHLHILTRGPFIAPSVVRRHWQELTGAPVVDVQTIRHVQNIGQYLAKYLTKSLTAPKGFHRFMVSAHFLLPSGSLADSFIPRHLRWRVVTLAVNSLLATAAFMGETVEVFPGNIVRIHRRCKAGASCPL